MEMENTGLNVHLTEISPENTRFSYVFDELKLGTITQINELVGAGFVKAYDTPIHGNAYKFLESILFWEQYSGKKPITRNSTTEILYQFESVVPDENVVPALIKLQEMKMSFRGITSGDFIKIYFPKENLEDFDLDNTDEVLNVDYGWDAQNVLKFNKKMNAHTISLGLAIYIPDEIDCDYLAYAMHIIYNIFLAVIDLIQK